MQKICICVFAILLCLGLSTPSVKANVGTFNITSPSALPDAMIDQSYSATINFIYTGSCTPVASITGLPPGIKVSNTDMDSITLAGTPTQAGSFSLISLNLSDGCGAFASLGGGSWFSMDVGAPPPVGQVGQLDTNLGLDATIGVPYNDKIYFDYCGPIDPTFSFTGLPPGITAGSLIGSISESYDINPQTGCPNFQIPLSGHLKIQAF